MARLKNGNTPRDEAKVRILSAVDTAVQTLDEDDDLTSGQQRKVGEQMTKARNSLARKWGLDEV